MRARGTGMLCLVAVFIGVLLAAAFVATDGRVFSVPVVSLSIVLLGSALIVLRVRRLGAFGGMLGMPRSEAIIRDHLLRETNRAVRYGRQLSVVVLREGRSSGSRVVWNDHLRASDEAISSSNGQVVLLLPETPRDAAQLVIKRIAAATGATFSNLQIISTDEVRPADVLIDQVATALRGDQRDARSTPASESASPTSVRT